MLTYVTRTVDTTFYQWWEWNYDLFSTLFWPDAWIYWSGVGLTQMMEAIRRATLGDKQWSYIFVY
jgi:hypothetical protein